MSDVIWAAAIAVLGSVGTGLIASYASTKVARGQQAVELAKVTAERDRLRDAHAEQDRRQRQKAYRDMLVLLNRLDTYATGWPADVEFVDLLHELNTASAWLDLVALRDVQAANDVLAGEFRMLGQRMHESTATTEWDKWGDAYLPRRSEFLHRVLDLRDAMRAETHLSS